MSLFFFLGAGQYELDEGVSGTKEKLYLSGDYYYQSIMKGNGVRVFRINFLIF